MHPAQASPVGSLACRRSAGLLRFPPEHQLLQVADPFEVPRLRCREDPLPQTPYVLLGCAPAHSVAAPEAALRSVHHFRGVQLALRFQRRCHRRSSRAHLTRVSALPGPGTRPGIRPVIQDRQRREPAVGALVSCCLPATGICLPGHPVPARELGLPHGRLTGHHTAPDPDGVSTFHTLEIRPGWVPPLSRGRRCPPWPDAVPGQRLPLPSGQSPHPAPASHRGGTLHETSTEVHAIHPPGLPLACGPQMGQGPLGVPLCSAPHCYQRRTTGRGRASSTRPELHDRHNQPSNPRVLSQGATSCRNTQKRASPGLSCPHRGQRTSDHPAGRLPP